MPDKPQKPRKPSSSSETGGMSPVDHTPRPDAPPPPDTLPEFDQDGGITGVMVLRAEGGDSAKESDSPTSSATSG